MADAVPNSGPCGVCGGLAGNRLHIVREMMFGWKEEFEYLECASCGCLQLVEIPEDLGRYYPSDYYSLASTPRLPGSRVKRALRLARDRYAVFGCGLLGRLVYNRYPGEGLLALARVPVSRQTRILDVGCGSGGYLFSLGVLGFRHLAGIDPFLPENTALLEGTVPLYRQEITDFGQGAGEWDLVMMHHSFEHMASPRQAMAAAARLLRPGGTCLIRTPTVTSFAWQHYGTDWFQIDAPRHCFIHSVESIRLLAREAGMTLVGVVYDSSEAQFLASEQYRRGIPLTAPESYRKSSVPVFSKAEIRRYRAEARRLNREGQGDQAAFYLRTR